MDLKTIKDLFQTGLFFVPDYQRGYAWTNEQIDDFFDDLKNTVDRNPDLHFTGTFTVINKNITDKISNKTLNKYEIVDGQQRITTISIFILCVYQRLTVLIDNLPETEKLQWQKYLDTIFLNIRYENKSILQLNTDCDSFYNNEIIDKSISSITDICENKSQEKLRKAKIQIMNFLNKFKDDIELIKKYYEILISRFKVNFYELSNEFEVGIVFETMNNRGIALSQIDKVKNYLMYLSTKKDELVLCNEINNRFGCIFKEMNKIDLAGQYEDDFLRYSYTVYTGDYSDSDIFRQLKTVDFKKNKYKVIEIKKYVKFLEVASQKYALFYNCNFNNQELNEISYKIIYLGNASKFISLIVALLIKFKEDELIQIFKLIEWYSFRAYSIIGRKANTGENSFKQFANHIFEDKLNLISLNQKTTELLQKYGDSESFTIALDSDDFRNENQENAIIYLFYEYENYLLEKNKLQPLESFKDFIKKQANNKDEKIEIEHISPQVPQNHEPLKNVNKLGNLVIIQKNRNRQLANKSFASKKRKYKENPFACVWTLESNEKWGNPEINKRTKDLIKFCEKKWNIKSNKNKTSKKDSSN